MTNELNELRKEFGKDIFAYTNGQPDNAMEYIDWLERVVLKCRQELKDKDKTIMGIGRATADAVKYYMDRIEVLQTKLAI